MQIPLVLIQSGESAVVNLLLDHGADVQAVGSYGYKPLHSAAQYGYVEVIQLLLSKMSNPEEAINEATYEG